jgi:hypothetical protein
MVLIDCLTNGEAQIVGPSAIDIYPFTLDFFDSHIWQDIMRRSAQTSKVFNVILLLDGIELYNGGERNSEFLIVQSEGKPNSVSFLDHSSLFLWQLVGFGGGNLPNL